METYTLTGIIAKDCEVRSIEGNKHIINFSIPETKKWKDKNGIKHEKTKWVNCTWWNDNDAIPQWLTKGRCVCIEGEITASAYIDNTGNPVAKLECRVTKLDFICEAKTKQANEVQVEPAKAEPAKAAEQNEDPYKDIVVDDLPF